MKTPAPAASKRIPFITWAALRRIVIVAAWGATLAALWYGVEDWRCDRAWERYRAGAEARGEHLDWSYFIPPPLPDDKNFATANATTRALFDPDPAKAFAWNDHFSKVILHVAGFGIVTGPGHFHFIDLASWEKALAAGSRYGLPMKGYEFGTGADPGLRAAAAPGVLRGLQDCEPILAEVRAASSRPEARYPVKYETRNPAMIMLPFYSQLQGISERLALRASAELALGRSDEAFNDLKLMFYISDSNKNEFFMIAILVRNILLARESQVIWEGLAGHRWTDVQLQEIQKLLLSRDFVMEMRRTLDMEQAASVAILEYYGFDSRASFSAMVDDLSGGGYEEFPGLKSGPKRLLIWMMPQGWYRLEQIDSCKYFQGRMQSVLDTQAQRIYPGQLASNIRAESPPPPTPFQALLQHRFSSSNMVAFFDASLICKLAASRCIADQAAIACGLERYHAASGKYPEQLDALAPAFIPALPHDALTGESYRYRLDGVDHFTLYSVGWDLKDGGGKPGAKWYGLDGDWVW